VSQKTRLEAQRPEQAFPSQYAFAPQTFPQDPQFWSSCRSLQTWPPSGSLQSVWLAPHNVDGVMQPPSMQLLPDGHTWPQPPQFAGSVSGLAQ
jgi:hypothetical protein